ncbi:hypothetical protein [uncultured Sphaerochaeta sp.]|uniref:hypothetical protein n=1 Tax=uncultured Sphaerochaeta sp. TaxID=886478 RepID=UPI002A0A9AE9|nr:hypothetical protein [uncultured Sphaerochaeta sp.]
MKRSLFSFSVAYLFLVVHLTGCSNAKIPTLVHIQTFDMNAMQSIHLDYDEDDIHILESKNEKLVFERIHEQE